MTQEQADDLMLLMARYGRLSVEAMYFAGSGAGMKLIDEKKQHAEDVYQEARHLVDSLVKEAQP